MWTALALAAAAATSFNLNCSGDRTTLSTVSDKKISPYSDVYRVDLKAKKWCRGECKVLLDVVDAQQTLLVLQRVQPKSPGESEIDNYIDRTTGEHHQTIKSNFSGVSMMIAYDGKCEKADFSGFPKFDTKF